MKAPLAPPLFLSNAMTLSICVAVDLAAVDLAAMRVRADPQEAPSAPPSAPRLPRALAPMAALMCAGLALSEFV